MKTLQQFFKTVSLKQLVVVFLAGVLMLVSTACGSTRAATPTSTSQYNPNPSGQAMYPHKDTERDTSAADAKADRLVRQAEQRRQKVQSPKDYVEEVTPNKSLEQQAKDVSQSAQQAAKNVGKSTKRAATNAAENTQKGLSNLRENASEAVDQAANTVDRATTPNYPNS